MQHLILPAVTMSVIPMGIIARTVRALVAEILAQEFVVGLRAKGLTDFGVFRHIVKNAAPTALAVMGLQLGYLLGGSILIETVFSWPGTGFLLNSAIFQRDLPLLQGTILVLAMFFVCSTCSSTWSRPCSIRASRARLSDGRSAAAPPPSVAGRRSSARPATGRRCWRRFARDPVAVAAASSMLLPCIAGACSAPLHRARRSLQSSMLQPAEARSARRASRSAPTNSAATCCRG